jgi:hypothetical protein
MLLGDVPLADDSDATPAPGITPPQGQPPSAPPQAPSGTFLRFAEALLGDEDLGELFDAEVGSPQDLSRHDEALLPVLAEPLAPLEEAGLLTVLALSLSGCGRQPADARRSLEKMRPGSGTWLLSGTA